ncbi:hypothetical protein FRC03_006951 [Tulasnella sp. 419]|nr:hypothetical protein FRC03_006951 [Tulasnella sp. 419]
MASRASTRGRRGNNSRRSSTPRDKPEPSPAVETPPEQDVDEPVTPAAGDDVCFICAEKVKFYAVSECNHRTCHVCSLRLRALYKKKDCTFCKEPQPNILFTLSPDQQYQEYELDSIQFKDEKLSVLFETQEMMEESLILLRFNCPDANCDYVGNGWPDLKWHVRDVHKKLMCDLCIRNKKIFSHEHTLYATDELPLHIPSLARRGPPAKDKDKDIESHPICDFCRECFFGDDELYKHLRERHEECFVCKKQGIQNQYFLNYSKLDHHFRTAHYPCTHPVCLEQKFVVFPTQLDLQAHTVDVHSDEMNSRDKRGARRVEVNFEHARHGSGRNRTVVDGQPEPPPPPRIAQGLSSSGPPQTSAVSGQPVRNVAVSTRRAAFGGQLTAPGPGDGPSVRQLHDETPPSRQEGGEDTPGGGGGGAPADPELLEKHAAFMAYIQSITSSPNALTAIRLSIRGYRANEATVYDTLDTIFNVLDRDMEKTGGAITRLVDIFDDEEKKKELLEAWGGKKIEHKRQFPSLTPLSDANPGNYSGIASGRVINVKHSTSNNRSNRGIWDRVEQAASSSSTRYPPPGAAGGLKSKPGRIVPGSTGPSAVDSAAFPTLSASASGSNGPTGPSRSVGGHSTPWSQSSKATPAPALQPYSVSMPAASSSKGRSKQPAPPPMSQFPGLPSTGNKIGTDYKAFVGGNQSLKKITGMTAAPAAKAWGTTGASNNGNDEETTGNDTKKAESRPGEGGNQGSTGKGKKKKGKETLFTLGSIG